MVSTIPALRAPKLNLALTPVLGLSAASTLLIAEPVDQGVDQPLRALSSLRWQHRIIVVDAQIPDAVARLRAEQSAIDERDIL